jgi:DHA1 family bicyclomycin/chloramphenicol resistance-like MFS transporter
VQIQPTSFAFTLLLGFLAAVPYSGIDINLPALAATGATLGASPSEVELTMSAFMLSLAVAPLIYGPVSDRFGRKPVVAFGVALFVVASLACAVAQSLPALLVCRFVQGLGAASTAMTFAIIRDLFGETTARAKPTRRCGARPLLASASGSISLSRSVSAPGPSPHCRAILEILRSPGNRSSR